MLERIREQKFYQRINIYVENPEAIFEDEEWRLFHRYEDKTDDEIINIVKGYSILDIEIDYFCEKYILSVYIAEERIYAKDMSTNFSRDYVFNHGLDAFNKDGVLLNANKIANDPTLEICCSFEDQYVGHIGLYVKGRCLIASNSDLSSEFDDIGRYLLNNEHKLITSEEEVVIKRGHGEAIVTDIKIIGIWCKLDANMNKVKKLQETIGVPVNIIS